jgi:hypothetical protein
MNEIKITVQGDKITTQTPYNPDFPARAKKLGGKWQASTKSWMFDARDEGRVRELVSDIYGTDGDNTGELVDVRVTIKEDWSEWRQGLFLYGKNVARAYGRDSGATIGDGVSIESGQGFTSSGSMKNWRTKALEGTVFILRDVPRKAFEQNGIPEELEVEIINQTIDRDALESEKAKLLARLAEIDELLNK